MLFVGGTPRAYDAVECFKNVPTVVDIKCNFVVSAGEWTREVEYRCVELQDKFHVYWNAGNDKAMKRAHLS